MDSFSYLEGWQVSLTYIRSLTLRTQKYNFNFYYIKTINRKPFKPVWDRILTGLNRFGPLRLIDHPTWYLNLIWVWFVQIINGLWKTARCTNDTFAPCMWWSLPSVTYFRTGATRTNDCFCSIVVVSDRRTRGNRYKSGVNQIYF